LVKGGLLVINKVIKL